MNLHKHYRLNATSRENGSNVLSYESISCAKLHRNGLVFGTESGKLYMLDLSGDITKTFQAHNERVTGVAVDSTNGLTVASCSAGGTVMVYSLGSDEDKEHTFQLKEALTSICLEDSDSYFGTDNGAKSSTPQKKLGIGSGWIRQKVRQSFSKASNKTDGNDQARNRHKSFIVGTVSGKLIRYRMTWLSNKSNLLSKGNDTAVATISWRGDIVAWADASQLKLLDVKTMTAICYLECPSGVSIDDPLPCVLFWASDKDLYIGWADTFRHLELTHRSGQPYSPRAAARGNMNMDGTLVDGSNKSPSKKDNRSMNVGDEIIASTVSDWEVDVIICGVSTFDEEHVLLFGYCPPELDDSDYIDINEEHKGLGGDTSEISKLDTSRTTDHGESLNSPELQIRKLTNGDDAGCEVLRLEGGAPEGPWSYSFLSTHQYAMQSDGMTSWRLSDLSSSRGGARGLAPITFVVSPQDIIVSKVKDVNDHIGEALKDMDMKRAVELACNDRTGLKQYGFHDLLTLYITDLLNKEQAEEAAKECLRLITSLQDAVLWERWIFAFLKCHQLHRIVHSIPISRPRLPLMLYEVILEEFLTLRPREYLNCLRRWLGVNPPIIDLEDALARLKGYVEGSENPWYMICLSQIYIHKQQFDIALGHMLKSTALPQSLNDADCIDKDQKGKNNVVPYDFSYIYDLIERENQFSAVKDSISGLMKFSVKSCVNFLVKFVDKIPIQSVVQQLRVHDKDRPALHWYLHMCFTSIPEIYNTQEYAEYHGLQVSLYAEFAPKFRKPNISKEAVLMPEKLLFNPRFLKGKAGQLASEAQDHERENEDTVDNSIDIDDRSDWFGAFLKKSHFAPMKLALKECERRRPPLYNEMVFIHAKLGNLKTALELCLREIGDIYKAIEFVEEYDTSLFTHVIDFCSRDGNQLAVLLDYIGISDAKTSSIVKHVPSLTKIPHLKNRIRRLMDQVKYKEVAATMCNKLLEEDALVLHKKLNQLQRKSVKVDVMQCRCFLCGQSLSVASNSLSMVDHRNRNNNPLEARGSPLPFTRAEHHIHTQSIHKAQLWGTGGNNSDPDALANEVVVFSSKVAYHRACYEKVKDDSSAKQSTQG